MCPLQVLSIWIITEIYMKKQYKSSITKNHKIQRKKKFDGVP